MDEILKKLKNKENLTFEESKLAFSIIMEGKASENQMHDFLVLMSNKGEVSSEIAGGVYVLRDKSKRVTVKKAVDITSYGAFLVAQQSAKRMLKRGSGSLFFTGASAGVKGFANSSVFAMGKFGLRGLAQALARELHPQNIHVGHFVIDGGIAKSKDFGGNKNTNDSLLDPDEIAKTYLNFHKQHRSAWAWEVDLRPWVESF